MKKFVFKINGNPYEVEVINVEGNNAEIEVNGAKFDIELEKKMAQPVTPKLMRTKREFATDQTKSEMKTAAPSEKKGAGVVKSPLPGTILQVLVREGDSVKVGDKLLVLEAMKMENNVNAGKAGVVRSIRVHNGDSVLEGDLLLEIGDA